RHGYVPDRGLEQTEQFSIGELVEDFVTTQEHLGAVGRLFPDVSNVRVGAPDDVVAVIRAPTDAVVIVGVADDVVVVGAAAVRSPNDVVAVFGAPADIVAFSAGAPNDIVAVFGAPDDVVAVVGFRDAPVRADCIGVRAWIDEAAANTVRTPDDLLAPHPLDGRPRSGR